VLRLAYICICNNAYLLYLMLQPNSEADGYYVVEVCLLLHRLVLRHEYHITVVLSIYLI